MWRKKRLSRVVGGGDLNTTLTAGSSTKGSGEKANFGFYDSGSNTIDAKIGSSMAFDNKGNMFITNKGTASIDKISLKKNRKNSIVTQIAGTSNTSSSVDTTGNNSDSKITLGSTTGIAIDDTGNKYVIDSTNHVINKIDINGLMTKLSGTHGTSGNTTTSNFNNPTSLEIVGTDLYVADKGNKAIRKINTANGSITSSKILGTDGDDEPESITHNSTDKTIYWVHGGNTIKGYDLENDKIIDVNTNTSAGFVDTTSPYATEGNPDMKFNKLTSIASDYLGNLYVSDHENARIRKIFKDPISSGTHTFTFANPASGNSEYVVSTSGSGWHLDGDLSSQNDPTIVLRKGDTYIFDRPDATHQLNFIKKGKTSWTTANSLGTANNTAISYSKSNNDITITIPSDFAGIATTVGDTTTYEMEFQYVCESHSDMRGTIKIVDKDFLWKSETIVGDGTAADKDNVEDDGDFQINKPLSVQVNNEEGSIYILDESNKIKKVENVFEPDDTNERTMIKDTGLTDSLVNTLKTFKLNNGKLGTVSGSTHTEADKLEDISLNLWDSATNIASGDSNAVKLQKNQKRYKRRRGIAKYLFKTNQGEETFQTTHDAMGLNTINGWTKTKVKVFKPRDTDDDPIEIDINAVLTEDADQGYYCPLDNDEACKIKPRGTGVRDFKITKGSDGKYTLTDEGEGDETFDITAAGGKFLIDGVETPALTLYRGRTYTFDQSNSSNNTHPFYLSETANGPHAHPDTTYAITVAGGKFKIDGVETPVLTLYGGRTYTFDQSDSTNSNHPLYFSETANGTHAQTDTAYTVTNSGSSHYIIGGNNQPNLTLYTGRTYTFNVSDNINHPFKLGTSADTNTHLTTGVTYNTNSTVFSPTIAGTYYYYCDSHSEMGATITVLQGSTKYTTGFTESGTPGSSDAYTRIVVAAGAPTLYYYCKNHSGMGNTANTSVGAVKYTDDFSENGTPGQTDAYNRISITAETPSSLFYYCHNHSGMGKNITVTDYTPVSNSLSVIAGNGSSYDTTDKFEDGDVAIIEGEPIVFGGVEGTGESSTFCFLAGTIINTDQGNIPIEKITNKNSINGLQVLAIVKTKNTTRRMIRVDKDAFGKNIPNKDTIMTRKHAIRLNNKWVTALKLAKEGKNRKVYKIVRPRKELLYNVLLDSYEKIYANNMPVESLHPRTKLAKFYKNFILNESKISSKISSK